MMAHFSDGTEQDVTRNAGNAYASSNTTVASIDTVGVVRNAPAPGGAAGTATLCGCYTPMGGGPTCTNGTATCSPIGTGRNITVTVSP